MMKPFPMPEEIKTEIDDALVNLNSPRKLGESKLLSLCMVAKYQQENPAALPYQVLKAVLTDILDILAKENSDYADILRGRFWEGLSPSTMVNKGRPQNWAEKTFYNYQKKARHEFYSLLWQREQSCKQDFQAQPQTTVQAPLSIKSESEVNVDPSIGPKPNPRQRVLILLVFLVLSTVLFLSWNKSGQFQPTAIPVTTFPTLTSPTSTTTSVNITSVCGETEQTPVDLSVPRFIRSQGVSNFTIENTPGLLNNTVRALAIDRTGLWIGYFGTETNTVNGVGHYDKKSFANCDFSKVIEPQNVNAIAVSQSGKTWIGTEKNGVLSFDGKEWRLYTTRDGLPSNEIFQLTIDAQDNLWVGTWEGVAKFDGINWSVPYQVQNDTIFNNHISAIAFDSGQNIWIGHIRDGVSEYRQADGKWIHYTTSTENGLAGDEIRSILVRAKNTEQPETVWFATAGGGISRFEQGKWTVYRVEDGLPSNDVSNLALDRYNRIWAATAKGVVYFDGQVWKIYNTIATSTIAIGSSCPDASCPFDDDHVWTGTPAAGLTHSRLPLPDSVIKVTSICFVTSQRERICPSFSLDTSLPTSIVTAAYPAPLKPDDTLRFEITVSPEGTYELRENRGDFMSNTDDNDFNLFGAWPVIGVKGIVKPGQPYAFTDYDNPFIAPKLSDGVQEEQFVSTWRMWMYTRYVGPYIRLIFTVKNN